MKQTQKRLACILTFTAICLMFALTAEAARPLYQMPFPCNEVWRSNTFDGHSLIYATDFNWGSTCDADLGKTVVASYGGTVIVSKYSYDSGFGNYVVIDHGGGYTSFYCHLNSRSVSVGNKVTRGQKVGTVGKTSYTYVIDCAHLHYEQRLNNASQKIYFNGSQIGYWEYVYRTSKNCNTTSYPTGIINTSGAPLNIRSCASTTCSIVGTVADGATVTIYCQKYGQTITGTYGTTSIWDKITSNGYVSDAYVYTGSDGLVADLCP